MHIMFLLALLCCHSLDIVAMEMDNEGITQLPENFAATALTDDCVGSMQGCIFNSNNPVAYVCTLMLLDKKKKSEKNMTKLQNIQNFLQDNIQTETPKGTQNVEEVLKALFTHLSNPKNNLKQRKIYPAGERLCLPLYAGFFIAEFGSTKWRKM